MDYWASMSSTRSENGNIGVRHHWEVELLTGRTSGERREGLFCTSPPNTCFVFILKVASLHFLSFRISNACQRFLYLKAYFEKHISSYHTALVPVGCLYFCSPRCAFRGYQRIREKRADRPHLNMLCRSISYSKTTRNLFQQRSKSATSLRTDSKATLNVLQRRLKTSQSTDSKATLNLLQRQSEISQSQDSVPLGN